MLAETVRRCIRDIGQSEESAERICALLQDHRKREAGQKLRMLRCRLMDELHACQRKVDQLDWLIRETEKQQNGD